MSVICICHAKLFLIIFVETTPIPPVQAASATGASTEQDVDKLTKKLGSSLTTGGIVNFYEMHFLNIL